MFSITSKMSHHTTWKSNFTFVEDSVKLSSTKYPNSSIRGGLGIDSLLQSIIIKSPSINDHEEVILYEHLVVEYSLNYGFLRLSPSARNRLGIPVMLVTLDSTQNKCFGNSVDQFFLKYLLGYDDLLLSSILSITENEQNQGLLRNIITGEYYRFFTISLDRKSYIASFILMVVFTSMISVIMSFSFHKNLIYNNYYVHMFFQILTGDRLAHNILYDSDGNIIGISRNLSYIVLAAASSMMLTQLMMVNSLSELFSDLVTAYYIVLIVCVANHYDTICSRSLITKRHFLKFFYLYYYSFYAYHLRFNGQNNRLALICTVTFIQHSMMYFYHRYEIPLVLHQAQQYPVTEQQLANVYNFRRSRRRNRRSHRLRNRRSHRLRHRPYLTRRNTRFYSLRGRLRRRTTYYRKCRSGKRRGGNVTMQLLK